MQTPPPPPPANQPYTSSVTCGWCHQAMDNSAIRCNSCGKIRKDIFNQKVLCYIFCALGGLGLGIGFSLLGKNKPANDFNNLNFEAVQQQSSNSAGYIVLTIGIIAALIGIFYYVKISQRLKNWLWV